MRNRSMFAEFTLEDGSKIKLRKDLVYGFISIVDQKNEKIITRILCALNRFNEAEIKETMLEAEDQILLGGNMFQDD